MEVGERVQAEFDGEVYAGTIKTLVGKKARVKFDDGEVMFLSTDSIFPETFDDEYENPDEVPERGGFLIYPIWWSPDRMRFKSETTVEPSDLGINACCDELVGKNLRFYGTVERLGFTVVDDNGRSTNQQISGFSLLLRCRFEDNEGTTQHFLCHCENYMVDPRHNLESLNKDICAMMRKWLFITYKGLQGQSFDAILKQARTPVIRIDRLAWLDALIFRLKELRETAVRSGGFRAVSIKPPNIDAPTITFEMNFTDIAVATDGKGVPMHAGDAILAAGSGRNKTERLAAARAASSNTMTADEGTVSALRSSLLEANQLAKAGDKDAKRKAREIRKALRDMGIKGGSRA